MDRVSTGTKTGSVCSGHRRARRLQNGALDTRVRRSPTNPGGFTGRGRAAEAGGVSGNGIGEGMKADRLFRGLSVAMHIHGGAGYAPAL